MTNKHALKWISENNERLANGDIEIKLGVANLKIEETMREITKLEPKEVAKDFITYGYVGDVILDLNMLLKKEGLRPIQLRKIQTEASCVDIVDNCVVTCLENQDILKAPINRITSVKKFTNQLEGTNIDQYSLGFLDTTTMTAYSIVTGTKLSAFNDLVTDIYLAGVSPKLGNQLVEVYPGLKDYDNTREKRKASTAVTTSPKAELSEEKYFTGKTKERLLESKEQYVQGETVVAKVHSGGVTLEDVTDKAVEKKEEYKEIAAQAAEAVIKKDVAAEKTETVVEEKVMVDKKAYDYLLEACQSMSVANAYLLEAIKLANGGN